MTDTNVDELPPFAGLAETEEAFNTLLKQRPHSWRWAVFTSVLLQRRKALEPRVREHHSGFAPATAGRKISSKPNLAGYLQGVANHVGQLGQQLHNMVVSPAFKGAFGLALSDDEGAESDLVVHNANRLMDYYARYLDLARSVRSTPVRADYVSVLSDAARLVDRPLAGIDKMVSDYAVIVRQMPAIVVATEGKCFERGVALELHVDDELWDAIIDRFRNLDD